MAREQVEALPLARRDYLLLAALAAIGVVLVVRAVRDIREAPSEAVAADATEPVGAATRLANSVAVLPFTNISSDPENEYFCDGISEEILNEMSTVQQLNVIGRTSSFAFKGSNAGIEKISALLGVQYVLQGSVRKAGPAVAHLGPAARPARAAGLDADLRSRAGQRVRHPGRDRAGGRRAGGQRGDFPSHDWETPEPRSLRPLPGRA